MTPEGTVVPPCGCCGEVWARIGELAFDSLRWKGDVVMWEGDVTSGLGVLFFVFFGTGVNTLSPIIMEDVEVENWASKWKESNTGDTAIFHFHDDRRKGKCFGLLVIEEDWLTARHENHKFQCSDWIPQGSYLCSPFTISLLYFFISPLMGGSTVLDLTVKLDYLPFWVLTSCLRAHLELLRRLSFERGKWLL